MHDDKKNRVNKGGDYSFTSPLINNCKKKRIFLLKNEPSKYFHDKKLLKIKLFFNFDQFLR